MKREIKITDLRPGDRFRLNPLEPIRTCKAVRDHGTSDLFIDCGKTTVTDCYVITKRYYVTRYDLCTKE